MAWIIVDRLGGQSGDLDHGNGDVVAPTAVQGGSDQPVNLGLWLLAGSVDQYGAEGIGRHLADQAIRTQEKLVTGEGVDALLEKAANLAAPGDWRARPPRWLAHSVRATFGAAGLAALAKSRPEADPRRPFATERTILDRFAARWNIAES